MKSPKPEDAKKAKGASKKKAPPPRVWQRPRGGPAKSISDLMPEVGRAAFRRFGFVQSSIVTRWPEIAGENLAAMSVPQAIKFPPGSKENGVLHLAVAGAHAVLMQHVEPEIIERVNRFFGYAAIRRVKLSRDDKLAVRQPYPAPPERPPNLKPVPIALGDSLRDIGDPELRAVLEGVARGLAKRDANAQKAGKSDPWDDET